MSSCVTPTPWTIRSRLNNMNRTCRAPTLFLLLPCTAFATPSPDFDTSRHTTSNKGLNTRWTKPLSAAVLGEQGRVANMATHLQQIMPEQLAECRGENGKPLWLSICGNVYDVSSGKDFYGPGGAYHVFAGRECSRALAFMRVTEADCNGNLEGATEKQLATLADWEKKLSAKYPCVGKLTAT